MADSLWMSARVRLAAIPYADEVLRDLRNFAFVASHLFSAGGHYLYAVAKILYLIEKMEEIHTKVQRMISSPHLAMTLLLDVLQRWSQHLNRCVYASDSEAVEALGGSVPFSLEPILVDIEGDRYVGPVFPTSLDDLVSGRRSEGRGATRGGSGGGSSVGGVGDRKPMPKVGSTGDLKKCGRAMKRTCPTCNFGTGRNRVPF